MAKRFSDMNPICFFFLIGISTTNHGLLATSFFLLLRSKYHDQALILRKWVVADSYDGYGGGLGGSLPRGFLEYEKCSQKVTVKVMNDHYAGLFIERVDVTDALAK